MNTQIEYGPIGKIKELEVYIKEQNKQISNIVKDKSAKTKIWLNNEKSLESRGQPLFSTHIELVRPNGKNLFVSKNDNDFLKCIRDAFRTMKYNLRR